MQEEGKEGWGKEGTRASEEESRMLEGEEGGREGERGEGVVLSSFSRMQVQ